MDVLGHGILNNGWKLMNGDPPNETSYSVPPVSGRGRPDTIFTQVKKKDPKLWVSYCKCHREMELQLYRV